MTANQPVEQRWVIVCKVPALVLDLYDVRSITPRYICMRECVCIYTRHPAQIWGALSSRVWDNCSLITLKRREGRATSFRLESVPSVLAAGRESKVYNGRRSLSFSLHHYFLSTSTYEKTDISQASARGQERAPNRFYTPRYLVSIPVLTYRSCSSCCC